MRKQIILLAMIVSCSFSFGQLQTKTLEEAHGYRTVYEKGISASIGCIRYYDYKYVLFGVTDNPFEDRMASIFLGYTKKSAIQTIIDIQNLKLKLDETVIVKGANNNQETKISGSLFGTITFKTDGVAGTCHNLRDIASKKAIQAIKDFEEKEQSQEQE